MKTVIGLVGEKGGGKGSFTEILQKLCPDKKIKTVRFSDVLKDMLELLDLPSTRENLQDLAVALDQSYGAGTLSHAARVRIENIEADIVVLDGIRWKTDVELLRSFDDNKLIYVTAKPEIRFERLRSRGEKKGESTMTIEQFTREEDKVNEKLIPTIGAKADYQIENDASMKEYEGKISEIINKLKLCA